MIRRQAPGFIFTPNHRISPRLSGKQPKSIVVGEPKSRIVQKHTFFAPERYTAEIL